MKVEKIDEPRFVIELDSYTTAKVLGLLYLADFSEHPDLEELALALNDVGVEEDTVSAVDNEAVEITFSSEQD